MTPITATSLPSSPAPGEPGWLPEPPSSPAHVIADDAEALAVAERLRPLFAAEVKERDRERRLPFAEVDLFSQSGLWGITIPKAYGGAGVSQVTLAKVFGTLAAGDPSLTQIAQNSFEIIDVIRQTGSEEQKRDLFGAVLAGKRLGNAFSEFGGKNVEAFETKLVRSGDHFTVSGRKFYSTGALFAHLVPVVALDKEGHVVVAVADRDAAGLEVVNDWSAFGQRTTASGTVTLDAVAIPEARVLPAHIVYENQSAVGPQSQLIHAAIDAGIARGAIEATIDLVRNHARPWIDSGSDKAGDDPYTIAAIGDLKIRLHAAEALLERAGRQLDETIADVNDETIAKAKIAVAEAKVLTTEVALAAANKLSELAGTRSTLGVHNLDRFWRDARTHTLHDPVRWKFHAIGQYYLNGVQPPLHSWI
ncbi:SfnB family sulfur acquisition oxidoreductase [Pararhizobium capsulatum DSM 1112]|uniref:SfnB family sulfur acquisition oxidoreductase n=1 Tax=Pararhizobium capsulatum DSM 1112 TaxID=1121113 RepID=A0ABU0BY21_9HYPH|nr:SfnB family sulfur acquisition oxidoreductase [Pararhizobium capsulatum]MDQ0323160.1 SfnB family sulfur acquisition oxidoreductase [Pararhizobium capsulatum DSM 1112]